MNSAADPNSASGRPMSRVEWQDTHPRSNHFNLLRLIFASMVMFAHSWELIDGNRNREPLTVLFHTLSLGDLAMFGFFILSGYLIVQSWVLDPHAPRFLLKRVLRIYPAFVVASAFTVFVTGAIGANDARAYLALIDPRQFAVNAFLLRMPTAPPTFEGLPYWNLLNGPLWSIPLEFQCYLVVAVVGTLKLFNRPMRWVTLWGIVFVLIVIQLQLQGQSIAWLNWLITPRTLLLNFFVLFAAGGSLFILRERVRYTLLGSAVAIALLVPCLFYPALATPALATAGAYLVIGMTHAPLPRWATLTTRTDLSYGVYLYGWPLQHLWLWYFPGLTPVPLFFLAMVTDLGAAYMSWRLVEHPMLLLKRYGRRVISAPRHAAH